MFGVRAFCTRERAYKMHAHQIKSFTANYLKDGIIQRMLHGALSIMPKACIYPTKDGNQALNGFHQSPANSSIPCALAPDGEGPPLPHIFL